MSNNNYEYEVVEVSDDEQDPPTSCEICLIDLNTIESCQCRRCRRDICNDCTYYNRRIGANYCFECVDEIMFDSLM